jgi:uncharacterized membrane protein YfcA
MGCGFAAILAGCTGIAGGMVLAPLFMMYDMIPEVVAGTNQYISMVATLSVTLQFIFHGSMIWSWACLCLACGVITSMIAIFGINDIIKKSGK